MRDVICVAPNTYRSGKLDLLNFVVKVLEVSGVVEV